MKINFFPVCILRNGLNEVYLPFLAIFFLFISSHNNANAQKLIDLELKVVDESNYDVLIGVNIFTDDYKVTASSNEKGIAEVQGIAYKDSVNISHIGYLDQKVAVKQILLANRIIKMKTEPSELGEVVVIAKPIGRTDESISEIPYPVITIDREEMDRKNPATSADALEKIGGIVVQRTQMGGGSPIIRGFETSRILLVVDGVRMNNAIYRSGHLQNSITVDPAMLDQMEVIFGPGSLMYGSDAIGGVVHFRSKEPTINYSDEDHRLDVNLSGRFASAALEGNGHFDIDYGKKNWAFVTSLSYTHFQNLTAGSNRPDSIGNYGLRRYFVVRDGVDQILKNNSFNIQRFTEYSQTDFMQKLKFQPNDKLYFVANYQYSTSSNIPRYDKLLDSLSTADDLKYSEWYYGPQRRLLASLKTRILGSNALFDRATIIGAYQEIDEERNERRYTARMRTVNKEDVSILSFTADFKKFFGEGERTYLSYGLDASTNDVLSRVRNVDIRDNRISAEGLTRYPSDESGMTNLGAYTNLNLKTKDEKFSANAGLRYTSASLHARYLRSDEITWPENFYEGLTWENQDISWAIGMGYKTKDNWHIKANVAKAFRSPNIDDFARIREKNFKITVPNTDLTPETSINTEFTIAKSFGNLDKENNLGTKFQLSATAFNTNLNNAIVRIDGPLPTGESFVVDGDDRYDTQINVNARSANVRGISGNVRLNVKDRLVVYGGVNIIKGVVDFSNEVVQDTLVPFDHIPPNNGDFGIILKGKKYSLEAVYRFNGAKPVEEYAVNDIEQDGTIDRSGTADNLERSYHYFDGNNDPVFYGTPAWSTLNFYSSFDFGSKLTVHLGVENILDKFYIPFASAVPGPGRNFIISMNAKF